MSEGRVGVLAAIAVAALWGGLAVPSGAAEVTEPDSVWVVPGRDALGTRLIDLPTPWPVGKQRLEVLITHRFVADIGDSDGHTLWGLDSGADVGLGVRWGFGERLDASLYRSRFDETYELAGKYLLWDQSAGNFLSIGVQLGVDHVGNERVSIERTRPFAQVAVARRLAPGWNVLLVPLWVRDTPELQDAFNVGLGLTVPLGKQTLLELEAVPANRDLGTSRTTWHVALSSRVGGHLFALVVGNSRATTVDQYAGGDFAGGFREGDLRIGFNILRNWRFGND